MVQAGLEFPASTPTEKGLQNSATKEFLLFVLIVTLTSVKIFLKYFFVLEWFQINYLWAVMPFSGDHCL